MSTTRKWNTTGKIFGKITYRKKSNGIIEEALRQNYEQTEQTKRNDSGRGLTVKEVLIVVIDRITGEPCSIQVIYETPMSPTQFLCYENKIPFNE